LRRAAEGDAISRFHLELYGGMTDNRTENCSGCFQYRGIPAGGDGQRASVQRTTRLHRAQGNAGRWRLIHRHGAMVFSGTAAALRQIRLHVGKDRRGYQREAEHSQQERCKRATHPESIHSIIGGAGPNGLPGQPSKQSQCNIIGSTVS
jgi:hypothetical protein